MARKYGKKASEKIGKTMREFKRGTLKRGRSGKKVTSRKQAIAIGLSQARRAGGKVPPPPRGHATMDLDARVRAYLSKMRRGDEIDARGIARALGGGVDPLAADYALERAERAELAVTGDGRWFGPAGRAAHATKKSPGQLNREIAEVLAGGSGQVKLKDRYSGGHAWLTVRDGRVVGAMGSDPKRYVGMSIDEARHHARYGGKPRRGSSSHATRRQIGASLGPHADRGDRVLADLERWGVDREQIDEVRAAFRSGDHRRAMALAKDLGWNRASKRGRSHATRRGANVEVDTSVYRRYHGADPRGFGNWSFAIGERGVEHSVDPVLYRPAEARGSQKAGRSGLPFARAKEYAIAEAKRRGASGVWVMP